MKNNSNNLFYNLLYFISFSTFFEIPYLTTKFEFLNNVYFGAQLCLIIFFALLINKNKTYSNILNYIILFMIVLFMSTIINNGDINNCIREIVKTISISLFTVYGLKSNSNRYFKIGYIFFFILILINFLTLFIYPDGMYSTTLGNHENWLLGYRNNHILYILPCLMFSFIYSTKKYGKLNFISLLTFLLSFLTVFITGSKTPTVGLLLIFMYIIIPKLNKKYKIFNIYNYLKIFVISYILLVFFRMQNIFQGLLESYLKRNVTLTGRLSIWDNIIAYILDKPILGYGKEYNYVRLTKTAPFVSYHAHNMFMEITYQTGFVGLIIFLVIILSSARKLYKYRKNKISNVIAIFIFMFLIITLTEFFTYSSVIYIFIIGYMIDSFTEVIK